MNKHNTILGQMLELISRSHFEKLVTEHKTEHGAKGLKSWTQFVSMLFAHISGQHGLRSIERGMNSHAGILYHLGIPLRQQTDTTLKPVLRVQYAQQRTVSGSI
jgi:hypothetical protein